MRLAHLPARGDGGQARGARKGRVPAGAAQGQQTAQKVAASSAEKDCAKASGVYVRVDKLASFVNDAVREVDTADPACAADERSRRCPRRRARLPRASKHGTTNSSTWTARPPARTPRSTRPRLAVRAPRQGGVAHGDVAGGAAAHQERLTENYDTLFGTGEGGGESGTTGAFLISGNVGFGRGQSTVSGSLMDLIFPPAEGDASDAPEEPIHEGDNYARRKGGELVGDLMTSKGGKGQPPDVLAYEELVKETIRRRSDFQYLYGDEGEFVQFQHRLWRYGPNFNTKKGGLWHKDTCPFGVNGAVPPGAAMYTIVYILYIENLDPPSAGTRMKDSDGSWAQLPCVAGEANIIRSGETDMHVGQHSGPLNIKKVDPSKPAYRVMMQSKALVRAKGGRRRGAKQGQLARAECAAAANERGGGGA